MIAPIFQSDATNADVSKITLISGIEK